MAAVNRGTTCGNLVGEFEERSNSAYFHQTRYQVYSFKSFYNHYFFSKLNRVPNVHEEIIPVFFYTCVYIHNYKHVDTDVMHKITCMYIDLCIMRIHNIHTYLQIMYMYTCFPCIHVKARRISIVKEYINSTFYLSICSSD